MVKTEQIVRDFFKRKMTSLSSSCLKPSLQRHADEDEHHTWPSDRQLKPWIIISSFSVSYLLSRSFSLHAKGRAICILNGHGTCSFCVWHYNSSSLKTQTSFSGQRLLSPPKPDRDWARPNRFNSTNDILARLINQAISEVITSAVNSAGLPD